MALERVEVPFATFMNKYLTGFQSKMENMSLYTQRNGCGGGEYMKKTYFLSSIVTIIHICLLIKKSILKKTVKGKIFAFIHTLGQIWVELYFLHAMKNCRTLEAFFYTILYLSIWEGIIYFIKSIFMGSIKKNVDDKKKKVVKEQKENKVDTKATQEIVQGTEELEDLENE